MKKALLVIDIQNDFLWENRDKKKFPYKNIDKLISNINNNIEKNIEEGNEIVYIAHVLDNTFISRKLFGYAISGTEGAQLYSKLTINNEDYHYFEKKHKNAFTVKELKFFLENHNINTIQICGIDEGGCVSKTAKGAVKLGLKVEILKDSIDTVFPIKKVIKIRAKLKKKGVSYI